MKTRTLENKQSRTKGKIDKTLPKVPNSIATVGKYPNIGHKKTVKITQMHYKKL